MRYKALKYVSLDARLHFRTLDKVLLKCLSQEESNILMDEIHEGVCGAHHLAYKMNWLIRRNEYFWSTMLEDYFTYYKGC